MSQRFPRWHVAVYAADEERHLAGCLASVRAALCDTSARITIILNGSVDRSGSIASDHAAEDDRIDIVELPVRDKSSAINHFFYSARSPADYVAQIDGYTRIAPETFHAFAAHFASDSNMHALSGSPLSGRSMRRYHNPSGGQLYGQLHAFRSGFIDRVVDKRFQLPIGLYRGDGLLGSMVAHNLDPQNIAWDSRRIGCAAAAGFSIPRLSPLSPSDLRRYHNRRVRQARGRLENLAIQDIIFARGYAALPRSADEMLEAWVGTHATPAARGIGWFYQRLAMHQLRAGVSVRPVQPVRAADGTSPPLSLGS